MSSTAEISDPPQRLTLKAQFRLFIRTWPYLRPQLIHLITWITMNLFVGACFLLGTLVAFDLFNNKVLVGETLEPIQARVLLLDSGFVRAPVLDPAPDGAGPTAAGAVGGAQAEASAAQLDRDQRRTVRNRMLILFTALGLLLLCFGPAIEYYRVWILQGVNQTLRVTMIERAEHLSLRYHSHARTGDAIYRVYQDSAMITSVVENVLLEPIQALVNVVFGFVIICVFSPVLGALFFFGTLPAIALVSWYTPRLQRRAYTARHANSNLTSRIQEAFAAIRMVKANQAEREMGRRFDRDSMYALDNAFHLRVELISMRMLVSIMAGLMIIAAQYFMSRWTVAADETFLAGAIALVGFTVWNLGAYQSAHSRAEEIVDTGQYLIALWGVVQDMAVGLNRAFFLLDLEPDVVDNDDAVTMPAPIASVVYEDVSFAYDEGRDVLRGVSLRAEAGTITAIVGSTGSGKSTLMSLLLRLYDPDSGAISINGTGVRDIRVDELRASVAIALQQNVLFAASVADNIAYATAHASRVEVEEAARIACADEFIREMPAGYDTELGERGGKLSTGQRQRLSIARAIVRNTPILILDEPTASLDAETEQQVLNNLSEWGRRRVVFLITHRLSTIRNADQIAFLENGVIAEIGSHEELMTWAGGRYRAFVNAEIQGTHAA